MSRSLRAALGAALLVFFALPAGATLGPGVKVTPQADAPTPSAGTVFAHGVEIEVGRALALSDFALAGDGWSLLALDAPAERALVPGERLRVDFRALPSRGAGPLTLSFLADGRRVAKRLDYDPARRAALAAGAALGQQPGTGETPQLAPGRRPAQEEPAPGAPQRGDRDGQNRTITVSGRMVYEREDGLTLGVDRALVQVFDQNWPVNLMQVEGYTDTQGYFSLNFEWAECAWCEPDPDLFIRLEARNTHTQVQDSSWEINYSWVTGTWTNYGGTNLNIGTWEPADESLHPALHILTGITRTWRWLSTREGYNTPPVDVQWPEPPGASYYDSFWQEIHITEEKQWWESTQSHEYGHHWINNYAEDLPPDYCNGYCDGNAQQGDCGHCMWCPETTAVAFSEGWPNWLADVITRSYPVDYGATALFPRDQEDLDICGQTGLFAEAELTEGFFGALMRDLEDGVSSDDEHGLPGADGLSDRLALGTNEIFDIIDTFHPLTPAAFLNQAKITLAAQAEDLWETAANCGFQTDNGAGPGLAGNLSSPSHPEGVEVADYTPTLTWSRPVDDASGVGSYRVLWTEDAPCNPLDAGPGWCPGVNGSDVETIGDVTSYDSGAQGVTLLPGRDYYFNIVAQDRAGNFGESYASYGPIRIRQPEPANLAHTLRAGWAYEVVPRATNDASGSSVPISASLPGNASSTYLNMSGRNFGESATSGNVLMRLYVDDAYRYYLAWGPWSAGGNYYANNFGPISIRGGRHTYESRLDPLETIAETNETDNNWGRQWIWTPYDLAPGLPVTRSAPPAPTGGWGSVGGQSLYYNCDGFRFSTDGWYNAVVLVPGNAAQDYDLRLHAPSSGATNGFGANLGWSGRGPGKLNAVIANKYQTGSADYDVGVLNWAGAGDFTIEQVLSTPFPIGDSLTITMPAGKLLTLHDFFVFEENVGPVSISIEADPAAGPLHLFWLAEDFAVGDLLDADAMATTDASGRARLDFAVPDFGFNGFGIYRDPDFTRNGEIQVVVELQNTPPDFLPWTFAGWHSPLVPRPANDGQTNSVALPDTLHGNLSSTWLNIGVRNESPTGASGLQGRIYRDGVYFAWLAWGWFGGYASSPFNWGQVMNFGGGRHALSVRLDGGETIEEIDEENNVYGEQYVWSPLQLANDTPGLHAAPPARTGGWEDLASGEPIWFNCDGLRVPGNHGWWQAIATVPSLDEDVDLRLHPKLVGAKQGFAENYAVSGWGPSASDFVLMNYNGAPQAPFDVGVLNQNASGFYLMEAVGSSYLGANPDGVFGPYTLGVYHLLDLYEIRLLAGNEYVVLLENLAGDVDWGISLHIGSDRYQSKSDAFQDAAAWFAPPGENETLRLSPTVNGSFCLAVWKVGTPDADKAGSYQLHIYKGSTPADDAPPARTALAGAWPNPFNPSTTLAFELAVPGEVRLDVYDGAGRRLRRLVEGRFDVGRHTAVWDGRDERGQPLPSGVYFARFEAGMLAQSRKLVLLK